MHQRKIPTFISAFGFVLATSSSLVAQSPTPAPIPSLTPPPAGPSGGVFKTLDQVEPRVPVNATNTAGDASWKFKITQPGSYYLTGDVISADAAIGGVKIEANNVSLDLMGFAIRSTAQAPTGNGIEVGDLQNNVEHFEISNGSIIGFDIGLDGGNSRHGLITHLHVTKCSNTGINVEDTVIDKCQVSSTAGFGISCHDSVVSNTIVSKTNNRGITAGFVTGIYQCQVSDVTGVAPIGIEIHNGPSSTTAIVQGCLVSKITGSGTETYGIHLNAIHGKVENCTVTDIKGGPGSSTGIRAELIHGCTVSDITGQADCAGITTVSPCLVSGCSIQDVSSTGTGLGVGIATQGSAIIESSTVFACSHYGVNVDGNTNGQQLPAPTVVRGCNLVSNGGGSPSGAGIHVGANQIGARIENNSVTNNEIGIHAKGTGCVITGNHATHNSTGSTDKNYDIAVGNFVGPIISTLSTGAVTGSSGGGLPATANSALANFAVPTPP